jgi:hypothetical protein
MTLDIEVQSVGGGEFTVEVGNGAALAVVASDRFVVELDVPDTPVEEIVREAVALLLDRRPGGVLGDELDLEEIAGAEDDFAPDLQSRLGF